MCGINGIVMDISSNDVGQRIRKMNRALAHRGPNADGIWSEGNVTLGHRRLSIIDLSENSNQPMHSADNNLVIVYNGELYNYKELKFELQRSALGQRPYVFKTSSDTEVILAAYMRYGIDCLQKMNGMFAFAIYDRSKRELIIARDRLGEKPVYYYFNEKLFLFSSELRALLASELVPGNINIESLIDYLRYQTVHAPETILKDVHMLMPGHYIKFSGYNFETKRWWNPEDFVPDKPNDISYEEAKSEIKKLFFDSVSSRLISDVPFGAFLSGGIDSSAIVAAMASSGVSKIETFNIAFGERDFSEAVYARKIAELYQTDHHEIVLTPDDFLKELPFALNALDHPGADGINTFMVSKATKAAGITMALSGLGGDEVFAGYDVFKRMKDLRARYWLNFIPRGVRIIGGGAIEFYKKDIASQKISALLAKPAVNIDYAYPLSRQVFDDALIRGLSKLNSLPISKVFAMLRNQKPYHKNLLMSRISVLEMQTYMQNVLLRDTDQMGMANALETRVPFLDYKLIQFCLALPDSFKIGNTPKKLLTDAMGALLPSEIIDRPKMGFVLPWENWLKNELKSFCENEWSALSNDDFLDKKVVIALWERFLKGDRRVSWSRIWGLVALCYWKRTNRIN